MSVSRVLSGTVPVSSEMREKVLDAVRRLDYRPNEVARSLREQKSHLIGIILPNLYDTFFASCAHAISLVAKSNGYSVVITLSDEDASTELEEANLLLRRHIDGLIVIPARDKTLLASLNLNGCPIVALDRPIPGSGHDSVLVQNREGTTMGVEHLLRLNHKRIAFVALSTMSYAIRRRQSGYRSAMKKASLIGLEVLVGQTQAAMLTAIRKLMACDEPPTAIFCSNNLITKNALHALSVLGLSIPRDIAVIGFDDFETADILTPSITVIRQNPLESGRIAAEMLFERMTTEGRDVSTRSVVLPVELVVRESCGNRSRPAKAKSAQTRS